MPGPRLLRPATSQAAACNYTLTDGQTPLHLAATAGYAGLVELLLAKGADVNAVDDSGRTALSYAVEKHYQPVVQLLLAAHADPNAGASNLPLTVAAYYGDMPALKLLLANGADPNINTNVAGISSGIYGLGTAAAATPLRWPLRSAETRRGRRGTDPRQSRPNGSAPRGNPLIFGALWDAPTLKALLEGGADPNSPRAGGDVTAPAGSGNGRGAAGGRIAAGPQGRCQRREPRRRLDAAP